MKEKRCKGYLNKFRWKLSIMMLLYYDNWKIIAAKQVWITDMN
jgi:hypothetical protein